MDEFDLELSDHDQNEHVDDVNCEISMPNIFETKFSEPISEKMAKFIKKGCTKKADIAKVLKGVKIPENCKNLTPP